MRHELTGCVLLTLFLCGALASSPKSPRNNLAPLSPKAHTARKPETGPHRTATEDNKKGDSVQSPPAAPRVAWADNSPIAPRNHPLHDVLATAADALKTAVKNYKPEEFGDDVKLYMQAMRLYDPQTDKWSVSELAPYADRLFAPVDIGAFIDRMAGCASHNQYLTFAIDKIVKELGPEGPTPTPIFIAEFVQDPKNKAVVFYALTNAVFLDRLVTLVRQKPSVGHAIFALFSTSEYADEAMKLAGSASMFAVVKFVSVQAAMKNSLKYMQPENKRPPVPHDLNGKMLPANILEAAIADYGDKFKDNAWAGLTLVQFRNGLFETDQPNGAGPTTVDKGVEQEQLILSIKHAHPRYWSDLYQTWNLAFLFTGDHMLHYGAFLTNPATLCEYQTHHNPHVYMFNRVWALYLGLMSAVGTRGQLESLKGKQVPGAPEDPLYTRAKVIEGTMMQEQRKKVDPDDRLVKVWGAANKHSAEEYISRVVGDDAEALKTAHEEINSWKWYMKHPVMAMGRLMVK